MSSTNLSRMSTSQSGINSTIAGQSNSSLEKEMQEYYMFRQLLINGDLKILKKELIHVLYKMYIRVIRNHIQSLAQRP